MPAIQTDQARRVAAKENMLREVDKLRRVGVGSLNFLGDALVSSELGKEKEEKVGKKHVWTAWVNRYRLKKRGKSVDSSMLSKSDRIGGTGSFVRVRNRCVVTGRARSVGRRYRLGRHALRVLASQGRIGGIRKSSW